jgi:hypothetical protein
MTPDREPKPETMWIHRGGVTGDLASIAIVYMCHGCRRTDAPALVEIRGAVVPLGFASFYARLLFCHECLSKAAGLFFDGSLVDTKTPMSPNEIDARRFAEMMHGDQKYDSGSSPYVFHLAAVRDTIVEFGFGPGGDTYGENYILGAWLHDVLEDTKATPEEVSQRFGAVTLEFVEAVTGRGRNRKERNENAYQKMEQRPGAIPLKLADRISNMRASKLTSPDKLFKMYCEEYPAFRRRLYDTSVRYSFKSRTMWDELDRIVHEAKFTKTEP